MNIGDHVRVSVPVTVYHHPLHKGQPFNLEGQEGEIATAIADKHGRPISPNYPWLVRFAGEKSFTAHLGEHELTLLEPR
jgi:hypothetical protein